MPSLNNNVCLSLANSVHYKGGSKHFVIRFQFTSDYVDRGLRSCDVLIHDSKVQLMDLATAPTSCLASDPNNAVAVCDLSCSVSATTSMFKDKVLRDSSRTNSLSTRCRSVCSSEQENNQLLNDYQSYYQLLPTVTHHYTS